MGEGEERVRLEIASGIATITLVREARMNAFDSALHEALRDTLTHIESDPSVRAVILTGSGRAFSAGQDLGERAAVFEAGDVPDLHASLQENYNPLVRRLAALPVPVIAAVNGIAFGAGAGVAIGCDIVLAAASARFQFGFVNVGLGPDSGASWYLPRLVGQALALDLALTGRPISAAEAMAMGLVSRVLPDEELSSAALAIASELAGRSAEALAAIKHLMRANAIGTFDTALDAECDAQAILGRTQAYRDAVLRFARARK
jgi:2-(1,2-epoxy-1,2-dihydrophenyl)acetyl-CoA isomerase